jgi:hypothetical protein
MHLFCLRCKSTYKIPYWAMKRITYLEYSYCNVCYKERIGKERSLLAKLFTRKGITYRTLGE